MNFTESITLLTSAAAFVTALATLWTVIELRSQRKDARKPELIPTRQWVYAEALGESFPPDFWDRWSEVENEKPNRPYSIHLFNIGNGPAKDVHVVWTYPIRELVAKFNKASQQSLRDLFFEHTAITAGPPDGIYELRSKDTKVKFFVNANSGMQTDSEYILPSTLANESTPIPLPSMFVLLCSLCVQLEGTGFLEGDRKLMLELEIVRNITMHLEYRDLANAKYERSFKWKLTGHLVPSNEFFGELTFDKSR